MSLAAGTRLEHYEILGPLGSGGMGEVYRASDTKLRREVAIKILPAEFARDESRLARFEREARVLAALNHPNIAAIYGLEHADGIRFLVLELVEGPTLAERLQAGPIETPEALRIASEIAEALEAAHEKGVVHRDLKPANIKLTAGGKVKVLDFGLAKAVGESGPTPDASNSPTMTMQATSAGIILGTAAYMSPEQAEGKPADQRADIWGFGVVLYEMLSGRHCFDGKTVSHILVHVIEQEPDWARLPASLPGGLRDLLKRCLEKDPARRLRDIGDVRLLLQGMAEQPPASTQSVHAATAARHGIHQRWLWLGLVLFFLSTAALGALYFWPKPAPHAGVIRFEIAHAGDLVFSDNFALSPDGRSLAFIPTNRAQLWIRSMDGLDPRPIQGTEAVGGAIFWSPDSRYIVFWSDGKIEKVDAAGGPALKLCDMPVPMLGGFWTPDDKIVFSLNRASGLMQIPASGGSPVPLTNLTGLEQRHPYASLLPDGLHFLYSRTTTPATGEIYLGSLDAKPGQQTARKVLPDSRAPAFMQTDSGAGYILFRRGSTLMAVRFDAKRLDIIGEPVPLIEQVSNFSISSNGLLAYRTGGGQGQQLVWFDRIGKTLGTAGDPWLLAANSAPALSPDGKRVAISRIDATSGNTDIWLLEFARGVATRFTFDPAEDRNPVWSPDGSKIVFASQREGSWGIYQKTSNLVGGEGLVYKSGGSAAPFPTDWSRDGRFVLFQTAGAGVWALPMEGDHKPIMLLPAQFNQRGARFSPNGRFFSYLSSESGKDEVYVRSFNPASPAATSGGEWMVSKDGGAGAHWRADGKELLYTSPDKTIMSVGVSTSSVFESGLPKALLKSPAGSIFWDVTSDGQRFLVPTMVGSKVEPPFTVVVNWTSLLPKEH